MKKLLFGLIAAQLFTLGWIFLYAEDFFASSKSSGEIRQNSSEFSFINPLLECAANFEYKNTRKIQIGVQGYIEQELKNNRAEHISYYARILNNGGTFGYNQEREYTPASLIKLPLAMAVLKNTPMELLSETVTLGDDFEVLSRNLGEERTEFGGTYTIKELLENMLIYSDNIATEALFVLLGEDIINTVYADLNLRTVNFDDINSVNISPQQYAGFFRILYNSSYLGRQRSEYLLRVLSKSEYDDGISSVLPSFIRVANKFGERSYDDSSEKQLHDCGIIYAPSSPYVLCIMSSGDDFSVLTEIIQKISSMIYTELL
ncbi:class A beta-lactamase-related serine hydrolase [Candidatus Gracilibacteria bacterium]|nr:class A beta-lactamase-related serine hydrolase [Candidatus Gracilibacteria bacterium]